MSEKTADSKFPVTVAMESIEASNESKSSVEETTTSSPSELAPCALGIVAKDAALLADPRFLPLGSITDYAGTGDPSSTWIICDGRPLSRSTYAPLFGLIGTAYGSGNGTTTFNIPDLRGRTTIGAGGGNGLTNRPLASLGGQETVTLTTAQMPQHRHALSDPGHQHQESFYSSFGGPLQGAGHTAIPAQASIFTGVSFTGITMANTGGGQSHSNMQPYIALNKIIRVL